MAWPNRGAVVVRSKIRAPNPNAGSATKPSRLILMSAGAILFAPEAAYLESMPMQSVALGSVSIAPRPHKGEA